MNRPTPGEPILRIQDASKTYGEGPLAVPALANVSLTLKAGEFVALMGPSGCGKSTLLNLAGGLETPDSGTINVQGNSLDTMSASERASLRCQQVGFIFQTYNLIQDLTALENVMLPLELAGIKAKRAKPAAIQALEEVGAKSLANVSPAAMSGGQQQRIAIARSIVGDRKLILADEPTGALDTAAGDDIMRLLRSRADAGMAVLLVTHDSRHASWSDRVVFLTDGKIHDESNTYETEGELCFGD